MRSREDYIILYLKWFPLLSHATTDTISRIITDRAVWLDLLDTVRVYHLHTDAILSAASVELLEPSQLRMVDSHNQFTHLRTAGTME